MADKTKAELQDAFDTAEQRIGALETENHTLRKEVAAFALGGDASAVPEDIEPGSWLVTLREGHPTGVYRRAGIEVSRSSPTVLPPDFDPDGLERLRADRWLAVSEVEDSAAV